MVARVAVAPSLMLLSMKARYVSWTTPTDVASDGRAAEEPLRLGEALEKLKDQCFYDAVARQLEVNKTTVADKYKIDILPWFGNMLTNGFYAAFESADAYGSFDEMDEAALTVVCDEINNDFRRASKVVFEIPDCDTGDDGLKILKQDFGTMHLLIRNASSEKELVRAREVESAVKHWHPAPAHLRDLVARMEDTKSFAWVFSVAVQRVQRSSRDSLAESKLQRAISMLADARLPRLTFVSANEDRRDLPDKYVITSFANMGGVYTQTMEDSCSLLHECWA